MTSKTEENKFVEKTEPKKAEKPKKPEATIFYSTNKEFRIGADVIRAEKRFSDGRISQGSKILEFHDHIFMTTDPIEMKVIRDSHDYELGRVKEISGQEMSAFITASASADN